MPNTDGRGKHRLPSTNDEWYSATAGPVPAVLYRVVIAANSATGSARVVRVAR